MACLVMRLALTISSLILRRIPTVVRASVPVDLVIRGASELRSPTFFQQSGKHLAVGAVLSIATRCVALERAVTDRAYSNHAAAVPTIRQIAIGATTLTPSAFPPILHTRIPFVRVFTPAARNAA